MSKKPLKTKTHPIETAVMRQIVRGEVQMKPRWYFVLGSVAMVISLAALLLTAVFCLNLLFFTLRAHGPMGQYRLAELTSSFPWWAVVTAAIAGITGAVLLRRYDFSYRQNFRLILAGLVISLILSAWVIDYLGLNEVFIRRGGLMRRLYQDVPGYNSGALPTPGMGRFRYK